MEDYVLEQLQPGTALPSDSTLQLADAEAVIRSVSVFNDSPLTILLYLNQRGHSGSLYIPVAPYQHKTMPVSAKVITAQYLGNINSTGTIYIHYADFELPPAINEIAPASSTVYFNQFYTANYSNGPNPIVYLQTFTLADAPGIDLTYNPPQGLVQKEILLSHVSLSGLPTTGNTFFSLEISNMRTLQNSPPWCYIRRLSANFNGEIDFAVPVSMYQFTDTEQLNDELRFALTFDNSNGLTGTITASAQFLLK